MMIAANADARFHSFIATIFSSQLYDFFANRMALVCRYPFALNKIQIYSDINLYRIILEDSANASGNRIHFVFTSFFSFFGVNEMRVVT